ncbi:hypothetical protein OPV22_031656 [Ensete ventricosum]|uniref:Uncharacterized protein n=1 Tax=Ensete ventricosum TaxID=4639 RepID=A0AAV8PV50_ENSVE|nr:hypothetical protein OPV22_031656 [Ensete ventricosum]
MKPASSSAAEDAIAPRFIRLAGAGRTTYHFPLPRPSHRKVEEAASLAMPMLSSVIKDWMRWLVDQRTSKQDQVDFGAAVEHAIDSSGAHGFFFGGLQLYDPSSGML